MEIEYKEFKKMLSQGNTNKCVEIIKTLLANNSVIDVYNNIIIKSMQDIGLPDETENYDIVSEHIQSNIISTVIENCFEKIGEEVTADVNKTIITCGLENELHNIGLRIASDYFRLASFNVIYLGVNIPNDDIILAIKSTGAKYIAISVTNFYHLPNLKKLVDKIRAETDVKVIVGGSVVKENYEFIKETCGVDVVFNNINEILEMEDLL